MNFSLAPGTLYKCIFSHFECKYVNSFQILNAKSLYSGKETQPSFVYKEEEATGSRGFRYFHALSSIRKGLQEVLEVKFAPNIPFEFECWRMKEEMGFPKGLLTFELQLQVIDRIWECRQKISLKMIKLLSLISDINYFNFIHY